MLNNGTTVIVSQQAKLGARESGVIDCFPALHNKTAGRQDYYGHDIGPRWSICHRMKSCTILVASGHRFPVLHKHLERKG